MNFKKNVYNFSRLVLAGVFMYSGGIKALDPVGFAGQIALYQLFPYSWNFLVAATLPYIELFCGVLLLFRWRVKPVTLILLVLNSVFIIVLCLAIYRGFDIDCGCFKPESDNPTTPVVALFRDLVLMVLVLLTWFLHKSSTAGRSQS
jgi:hypothetical protein